MSLLQLLHVPVSPLCSMSKYLGCRINLIKPLAVSGSWRQLLRHLSDAPSKTSAEDEICHTCFAP